MNEPRDESIDRPSAGLRASASLSADWRPPKKRQGTRRWLPYLAILAMVVSFLIASSLLSPTATFVVLAVELIVFMFAPEQVRRVNRARSSP